MERSRSDKVDSSPRCPDCQGGFDDHNAVNRVTGGLVAHSSNGGACWKSLNSEFTHALKAHFAERSRTMLVPVDECDHPIDARRVVPVASNGSSLFLPIVCLKCGRFEKATGMWP